MAKLRIYNKDNSFLTQIELNSRDDILKQLLNNDVKIFYGCMGGSCGACACNIISGEDSIDKEGRKPAVIKVKEEGDFLPCVATIRDNVDEDCVIEIKKKL